MRDEGQGGSAQAAEETDELSTLRARNEALEASLAELRAASARQAIATELKSEALRRGIIDLDGLKLVGPDEVRVDESGSVLGAQAAVARLRREKPWLFGTGVSGSVASVPAATPPRPKLATEMTLDEWRLARAELLRRR